MIKGQIRERGSELAVSGRRPMTYADLGRESDGIARALSSVRDAGNRRVIVLSAEPESQIAALLGVLRAECTYVPVLPELPSARLDLILRKVRPVAVLHDANQSELAKNAFPGVQSFALGTLDGPGEWPQLPPDHPAYIFFTSGSTGEPKGILGRYASLSQFIQWEAALLGLQGPARVAQLLSPMFDAFLRDVLLPLSVGGCCCVPEAHKREDATRLSEWIAESRVEVVHGVPSLFRTLFGAGTEAVRAFPDLKHVLLSGEALLPSDVALWTKRLGQDVALYNLYGATETTMIKFFHRVSREEANAASIPVGRPMLGATAWIADADLRPLPDGEPGEILVETEFRTLGYLDDPEATNRAFVTIAPSRVAYRTGDIGKRRHDGVFELLGRRDRQVKIRGVRVEPLEIEEAARSLPGVLDCVVDVERLGDGSATLTLYVVLTHGLSLDSVRAHLEGRLPATYLPSGLRACREIPRLLSGKVDFEALRVLVRASRGAPVPAATEHEAFVLDLFRQLIGDGAIGVEDNFFDAGGHSLLAIQVLSRVREQKNVEVPLGAFFENATARALAALIEHSPSLPRLEAREGDSQERIELSALSDQDLEKLLSDLTRGE